MVFICYASLVIAVPGRNRGKKAFYIVNGKYREFSTVQPSSPGSVLTRKTSAMSKEKTDAGCYTQEDDTMAEDMRGGSVEFQTVKSEEVKFGKNNFLEIARKKAITQDGENEFLAISRGFFLPDGTKRFKKSIAIPDEDEVKKFVTEKINNV